MHTPPTIRRRRAGLSLVELIITLALTVVLMTPLVGLLRMSSEVYEAYESDHTRLAAQQGALQHLTRLLRETEQVLAVSKPNKSPGYIRTRGNDGQIHEWRWRKQAIYYGSPTANTLLASNIESLTFQGYAKPGSAYATTPGQIRMLEFDVGIELEREQLPDKTLRGTVWLRPW